MVSKILERLGIGRRERERQVKRVDPLLERLTSDNREERIAAFDEIMANSPQRINETDVFDAILGDRDLVRHAVLREYHVKMDDEVYPRFKEIVKRTLANSPKDAIQLLSEITEKNMKSRESIERTLDLFDEILGMLPAKINAKDADRFLKFYGRFKRKMREFSSRGEKHEEFAKKMIVKSGHRVAKILARIANDRIARAKGEEDPEKQFKAWKSAHALKMEALWLLQKMAKHADSETVAELHGNPERLNVLLQNALANVAKEDLSTAVPLGKETVRERMLQDRANAITKTLNRGIQNGVISTETAKGVLELTEHTLGPHMHGGVSVLVADLISKGKEDAAMQMLTAHVQGIRSHSEHRFALAEIDRFAGTLYRALKSKGVPEEKIRAIEAELNRHRLIA